MLVTQPCSKQRGEKRINANKIRVQLACIVHSAKQNIVLYIILSKMHSSNRSLFSNLQDKSILGI